MNPICNSVHVRVPATSANLGSGFDTVGLALDYHDELTFTLNDDPNDGIAHVIIHGEGADTLPCDETHLVVSTFRRACATFGLGRLGFTLEATNNIPQARGMGSSAEAIVAGIAAAAAFAQTGDLNRPAVFDMAAQIEGHPDNVAPAVFGGLTVSWDFETAEGVARSPFLVVNRCTADSTPSTTRWTRPSQPPCSCPTMSCPLRRPVRHCLGNCHTRTPSTTCLAWVCCPLR